MKTTSSIRALGILIIVATAFLLGCSRHSDSESGDVAYHTCSMHPQVRSPKPGRCPICGMNLEAVRKTEPQKSVDTTPKPATAVRHTCPMHPEVQKDQTGQCPSCGMNLEPMKNAETKPPESAIVYSCPMHPEIRKDHPDRCPLCGMDLELLKTPPHEPNPVEVHLNPSEIKQAGVRIEEVQQRTLSKDLLIFGTLGYDLNSHRDVVTLVEGRVERQFIDFNRTEVKKNEPLIEIYSEEGLRLQEEYLKTLRERWLSTFHERSLLDSMLAVSRERLTAIGLTREDLDRLEKEQKPLSHLVIRSPIDGSIVGNMVHVGEMIKKDQPLYHIVPLGELWFNAQVFEPDLSLLKLGQKIRISTKSFPGEEFHGQLTFIGRSLDASNRTIPVRFTVSNQEGRLLPNLSASGNVEIPLGKVLSVPNSAVLDLGNRQVTYIRKEEGVYQARTVKIGHITAHYTQILSGLDEEESVVTSGAFLMDAQSQLRSIGSSTDVAIPAPTKEGNDLPTHPSPSHQH